MATEQEVIADEARFIDMPAVVNDAMDVVERTKNLFSMPKYPDGGRALEVGWLTTQRFRAYCAVRPGSPDTDLIRISYTAAREIYRDAFVLPLFCERHFSQAQYEPIFGPMRYGGGTARVLPEGLTTDSAKTRIMNATLAWLYLHEQSHLFQNHGAIGLELDATWAGGDSMIDEMRDRDGVAPIGRSAALSHVFELAADHEALNNVIGLILKANSDMIPAHTLWSLVVGLTCMFQRFYGVEDRIYGEDVAGTHPDPSFRVRMLLRSMTLMIMQPSVRRFASWIGEREDLEAVVDHAVIVATIYCHLRYRGGHGVSAFLPGVQAYTDVPVPYQQALFDMWREARPLVLRDYRGWGEECVLELPSIAHLS